MATKKIYANIDSLQLHLDAAKTRNFKKYDILNKQVWPNPVVLATYNNEITALKQWINKRVIWMDAALNDFSDIVTTSESNKFNFFPNPIYSETATFQTFLDYDRSLIEILIFDIHGRKIHTFEEKSISKWEHNTTLDMSRFSKGTYIYQAFVNGKKVHQGKFVKI